MALLVFFLSVLLVAAVWFMDCGCHIKQKSLKNQKAREAQMQSTHNDTQHTQPEKIAASPFFLEMASSGNQTPLVYIHILTFMRTHGAISISISESESAQLVPNDFLSMKSRTGSARALLFHLLNFIAHLQQPHPPEEYHC